MGWPKPNFTVDYVYDSGRRDHAVVPLSAIPGSTVLDRRDLLRTSITASSVLAMLGFGGASCAPTRPGETPVRPPLPSPDVSGRECGGQSHLGEVTALAMDFRGNSIASSGQDGKLKIWTRDGALATRVAEPTMPASVLSVSRRGALLAASDADAALSIRDFPSGAVRSTVRLPVRASVRAVAFSADDRSVIVGDDTGWLHWITHADGRVVVAFRAHHGQVRALATADYRTFFSAGGHDGDGTIVVWEPFASKSRTLVTLPGTTVSALAVPAGANFVCVGTTTGDVLVVDARGTVVKRFLAHDQSVTALVVSPRLGWIVSAGDEVVRIWSVRDLSLLHGLASHPPRATALALDAEGALLAVGTAQGVVKTWALPSMRPNECFIDLSVSPSSFKGTSYDVVMADGRTVSYTLPCGAPTPPGAVCTCNCVPGEVTPVAPTTTTSNCDSPIPPGATCTCNCVSTPGTERCLCVPVCTCMAV